MSFTVRADRRYIRTGYRSNRFVLASITAPASRRERTRPPVNLAFVLDRSGSMAGEKIRLARQALDESIGRLHPDDRFSVVVYDDVTDVVVESAFATPDARTRAMARLGEIDARGSTNLAEGWLRGCEQVAARLAEEGVNRCLLLTDGLANVGVTDAGQLAHHAAELRARGVSTSTFGVGADYDETLLQQMADAGGGHAYHIESAAQIRDLVTSEVGETLDVVARGATLTVLAPEDLTVEPLSPFASRSEPGRTTLMLGDLVSEQRLEVVLRLNFPLGNLGAARAALFEIADRDGAFAAADPSAFGVGGRPVALEWNYADDRTNDLQERDRDVDRAVARIFAARARQEAVGLNRQGRFPEAAAALRGVAERIRGYAGQDPELHALAASLQAEMPAMAAAMPEMSRKQMFTASAAAMRTRTTTGKAIRGS